MRTSQGIAVQDVWDFGVEPIPSQAMRIFARPSNQQLHHQQADMLPRVPEELWESNRYPPVPETVMNGPPLETPPRFAGLALDSLSPSTRNATLWLFDHQKEALYASKPRPVVRISGSDIQAKLVNFPVDAEPVQDLVLDLSSVLKAVSNQDRYLS